MVSRLNENHNIGVDHAGYQLFRRDGIIESFRLKKNLRAGRAQKRLT